MISLTAHMHILCLLAYLASLVLVYVREMVGAWSVLRLNRQQGGRPLLALLMLHLQWLALLFRLSCLPLMLPECEL
ncbi:hypothetical protein V8C86DRAFT_2758591, partial [Haematococcus lacustris]